MTQLPIPSRGAVPATQFPSLPGTSLTDMQQTCLDLAWLKVEDAFDSFPGGPYLLQVSKQNFGEQKIALLFPFAFGRINSEIPNPPTTFDANSFPYGTDAPLFAQALVLEIILHLIRSYVEQPDPQGSGNITWLSRKDYEQRWKEVWDLEHELFLEMLRAFKRKYLNLGRTKGVLHWKAGRLMPLPMRTRVPRTFGW